MKIGPKYKIARRLGASVFEKTQTQKFALRSTQKSGQISRPRTNFGSQLLEKQKVRYTYGLTESQFAKYVNSVISKKTANPAESLYQILERRLDNVVLRSGFAVSRMSARQMVSHGHILLNGRKTTVPSTQVKTGDIVTVRERSKDKPLFANYDERAKDMTFPAWLMVDVKSREIKIGSEPIYKSTDLDFELPTVIQFYKR